MRVCIDCGNEQEYGRYCEKCNATVFEYQHASYGDDVNPDEIQDETQEQTDGGTNRKLFLIVPVILVVILVPTILILASYSESSGSNKAEYDATGPTTNNESIGKNNTGYPQNADWVESVSRYYDEHEYNDTYQPFEYYSTQHNDWYYDSSCVGATAICNDGWCSYCENRDETCSYHGGVKTWLR